MERSVDRLLESARSAAERLKVAKDVLIVAHIDADGISAAAIASSSLSRRGVAHRAIFLKKLDEDAIAEIDAATEELAWIVDLGSGYLSQFTRQGMVVTDHHTVDKEWRKGQTNLLSFPDVHHVNPHEHGVDGSSEICGAGVTYLVARELDGANVSLAHLAIVGAAGDFQDSDGSLKGFNRQILQDAVVDGTIEVGTDLRLFGRITRPLPQLLQYCNDPHLPGLTSDNMGCVRFLNDLGIDLRKGQRKRTWIDLADYEREVLTEALIKVAEDGGADISRFYGEVYTLPNEKKGTELRDVKEYATLLNSCGRYDDAETGMRICLGDPAALEDSRSNRDEHRRQLSQAMNMVRDNDMIKERGWVQFFHSGGEIRETIVGIVAGMLLGNKGIRRDIPMVAFADSGDGEVKVSARGHRDLVSRGLNLSKAVNIAADLVGGYGGGHDIAAGATIPVGTEERFLEIIEDIVASQII